MTANTLDCPSRISPWRRPVSTDDAVTIELATVDDIDAIADCWVALAADQQQHGSRLQAEPNRTSATETIARHVVTDGVYVAREDGVRGFVMFHVDAGTYSQTEPTGTITTLYVRPSARNEGLGTRLLAAAERALADRGAATVSLEVLTANEAAREFYDRRGYDPHRIELRKRIENDTHSKDDP